MAYSLNPLDGSNDSNDSKRRKHESSEDPLKKVKIIGASVTLVLAVLLVLWNAGVFPASGNPDAKLPPPSESEVAVQKNPGKTPAMVQEEINRMPPEKRPIKSGS